MDFRTRGQQAALTKLAMGALPRALIGGLGGAGVGAGVGAFTAAPDERFKRMRQGALIGGGLGAGAGAFGHHLLKALQRKPAGVAKTPAYEELMARLEGAGKKFEQQSLGNEVYKETANQGLPEHLREQLFREHGKVLAGPNLDLGKLTDPHYAELSSVARDYLKKRGITMAAHESPLGALEGNLRVGAEDRARDIVSNLTKSNPIDDTVQRALNEGRLDFALK